MCFRFIKNFHLSFFKLLSLSSYLPRFTNFIVAFLLTLVNNLFLLNPFKKGLFHKLKQIGVAYIEFFRLAFSDSSLTILISYDFSVSPRTYGDFLYVIFLARYFLLRNRRVCLFCPNSSSEDFIDQFKSFSDSLGLNIEFITDKQELNVLLRHETPFRLFSWPRYLNIYPFKHNFNLLNLLLKYSSHSFRSRFLIAKSHFPEFVPPFPRYIALNCRYRTPSSPLYKLEKARITDSQSFIRLVTCLSTLFENIPIVVLTCSDGIDFYSSIVREQNLSNVFFTAPDSGFFGEVPFVVFADSYFQLNGGGIGTVSKFTDVPYLIASKLQACEVPSSLFHQTTWSRCDQIYRQIIFDDQYFAQLKFFRKYQGNI